MAGYAPAAAAIWIRRSGVPPSTAGDDSFGHMLHLENDQPEVARAARWYLEPVDYLSMRFTGVGRGITGIDGGGVAHRHPPAGCVRL